MRQQESLSMLKAGKKGLRIGEKLGSDHRDQLLLQLDSGEGRPISGEGKDRRAATQLGQLTLITPLSTRLFSAMRYLVSPNRSRYRRQKASVPKFRSMVARSCLARGNLQGQCMIISSHQTRAATRSLAGSAHKKSSWLRPLKSGAMTWRSPEGYTLAWHAFQASP